MTRAQVVQGRLWGVATAVTGLGAAIYVFSVYQVLQAGGLTRTSEMGACGEAATGTFDPTYRMTETLAVEHGYFPPSAVCRWSGGTEATLVAPTWTWTGIVVVAVGVLVLLVLRVVRGR